MDGNKKSFWTILGAILVAILLAIGGVVGVVAVTDSWQAKADKIKDADIKRLERENTDLTNKVNACEVKVRDLSQPVKPYTIDTSDSLGAYQYQKARADSLEIRVGLLMDTIIELKKQPQIKEVQDADHLPITKREVEKYREKKLEYDIATYDTISGYYILLTTVSKFYGDVSCMISIYLPGKKISEKGLVKAGDSWIKENKDKSYAFTIKSLSPRWKGKSTGVISIQEQ